MNKLFPCATTLVVCLLVGNKAITTNFLGAGRRYDGSNIYDSYYCCRVCEGQLLWMVNEDTAASFPPGATIGNARRTVSSNNASIVFNSMLLSVSNDNGETCMVSVLIITTTFPLWRPHIICRGRSDQDIVSNSDPVDRPLFKNFDDVNIAQISPDDNQCASFINVCYSNNTDNLLLSINQTFVAAFNASAMVGDFKFEIYPSSPTRVLYEALLIEKNDQSITSVIIWNGSNSGENLNVQCNNIMLPLDNHITTSITTDYYSSTAPTDRFSSSSGSLPTQAATTGTVAVLPYFASTYFLLGITIIWLTELKLALFDL